MPKYDDRTSRGWPLPHKRNKLSDDADRLREALTSIDADITDIETNLKSVSDVNDFLSTRMEVIVGEATEDTEILDARVDSEGNVHQNLGQNVRNIHSGLLGVISDIKYGIKEFHGLLRQFNALAEAQVQDELNVEDANERRKKELQQETLTRREQDEGLQRQIDEASRGVLENSLSISDASSERRTAISCEEDTRISADRDLQKQVDMTSQAILENAINIHDEAEVRRAGLLAANERIDTLNEALNTETGQRISEDSALDGKIQALDEEAAILRHEAGQETQARAFNEKDLRVRLMPMQKRISALS